MKIPGVLEPNETAVAAGGTCCYLSKIANAAMVSTTTDWDGFLKVLKSSFVKMKLFFTRFRTLRLTRFWFFNLFYGFVSVNAFSIFFIILLYLYFLFKGDLKIRFVLHAIYNQRLVKRQFYGYGHRGPIY